MKTQVINIAIGIGLMVFTGCASNNEKSDAYGNFESREVIVSAQTRGEILSMDLEEGETLKAGKLVGWIDTSGLAVKKEQLKTQKGSLNAKLANINAKAEVQKEQIESLLTEKKRIERLLEEDAATDQQFDNIQGKLNVARKRLESINTQKQSVYSEMKVLEKRIKEVNTQIDKCKITNPIKGTVLEKYLEPSEIAAPGKALYKIADLSEMILRVYISGDQLPLVQIGQQVEVLIDKNEQENQKLSGTVSWISPKAEFTPKIIQTKEERVDLVYAVKVRVNNDGRIKIGMPGEVNF
ncbi:MAG: HlyD family efflux transporter periplasmic adaptor subunit [Bacteroidales bacterium]|nr:HlyD family efflux transporter periplasmic adaptor subunit [Bacteroidales bacterium]